MEYEVIVKYNGGITFLEQELGVTVEILGYNYAIITADTSEKINNLLNYTQIEYVEKPFILETQDEQSFSSTGITEFKQRTNLSGKGVLLGLIDSGIDYNLPIFKDEQGKSKILYYWDQSINGNPPDGFKQGSLYTNEDITATTLDASDDTKYKMITVFMPCDSFLLLLPLARLSITSTNTSSGAIAFNASM
jgi:hypothetical protein